MTEKELIIELLQTHKETMDKILEVFKNSGYIQGIIYAADDNKENWFKRSRVVIAKAEKFLSEQ